MSPCFPMQWTIPKRPFACSYVDTSVILDTCHNISETIQHSGSKPHRSAKKKSKDYFSTSLNRPNCKFGFAFISNCLCLVGERASIMYALCSAVDIKTKCFHESCFPLFHFVVNGNPNIEPNLFSFQNCVSVWL